MIFDQSRRIRDRFVIFVIISLLKITYIYIHTHNLLSSAVNHIIIDILYSVYVSCVLQYVVSDG